MHIGLVGGLDRNEGLYQRLALRAGHSLEHHNGHLAGRGSATLSALAERADVLIVVTDVNSHAAVWQARRLAKQKGRVFFLMSRCGPSRFNALLEQLKSPGAALHSGSP